MDTEFPAGAALVIGGSGGVGRAICTRLAQAGTDVALTYRNNAEGAKEAAQAVRSAGQEAEVLHLAARPDAAAAIEATVARFGGLHALIYAAGPDLIMPYVSEVEVDQIRAIIDADVGGFFAVLHAALPHLRASHGALVAVSSAGVKRHPPGDVLSVAPKAAIEAIVRAVAKEEGRYGVRANAVALGVIETGQFHRGLDRGDFSPEWVAAAKRNTPLRRFGSAEEVAEVAVFLASTRASYVTGQTIALDGGFTV